MTQGFQTREYWENRLGQHCDLAGVGYLTLGRRYNSWLYRVRARVFDRVVSELPVRWPDASVLDVGAGTGFYVERWRAAGVGAITGVDLTQVAVDALAPRYPAHTFHRVDIGLPLPADGPLSADSFDAISAMDVLFHIVDDSQYALAFQNIARLLKPGGWFLWSDNFVRHGEQRVRHQASRSLAESERCVEAAGLEIVGRRAMFVLMNYPADTASRIPKWLWTAMVAPATLAEPIGGVLGALLYPLETWLVDRSRQSPSTELMVCRKPLST